MPITKIAGFRAKDARLASMAKALAHPARVAIMRTLAKRDACVCGEIVEALPIAQATVSQHLKELKNAGLVEGTVEGPSSCYCLNKDAVGDLARAMNAFFDELGGGCGTTSCPTKGIPK